VGWQRDRSGDSGGAKEEQKPRESSKIREKWGPQKKKDSKKLHDNESKTHLETKLARIWMEKHYTKGKERQHPQPEKMKSAKTVGTENEA